MVDGVLADGLVHQVYSVHVLLVVLQDLWYRQLSAKMLTVSKHFALLSWVIEVGQRENRFSVHPDSVCEVVFLGHLELTPLQMYVLWE